MKAIFFIALIAASLPALCAPALASTLDSRIVSAARETYVFKVYLAEDEIKIDSKDGAVTLTGLVAEDLHRALAEATMTDIPGVRSVDNRLEIKGSSPTANSDAWLHDKVKAALMFHWSVSASTSAVEVKDGVVTLRGNAVNREQKELTTEYAKDIDGVKDVTNEMTVVAPIAPRTTDEKIDDVSVAALVRMALLLHHSTSGVYTTVAARRGVVTVEGRARSAAEKERVTKVVKDVNGVKKVKNRMTIDAPKTKKTI